MRKMLVLILSCLILFGSIVSTSASNVVGVAGETATEETEEAVSLLAYMGIVEEDEDISSNITRAEFASLVAKILNMQITSSKQYYTDVGTDFWAFDAITALTEFGYLSAGDNMLFRPDDNIKLAEAAKIATSAVGYGVICEANGGYPSGYLQVASRLGITNGISSELITKNQAYVMLLRTMNTPLYLTTSVSAKGIKYKTDEASTILSLYYDIYYIKDTVNAAGAISIVSPADLSEGQVLIGSKKLTTDEISIDMYDYIGMTVIGYYTESESKKASLIFVLPLGKKNSVTVVEKDAL